MLKLIDVSKGEQVALFNNIAIETTSICFKRCYFCPVGTFKRHKEEMSWDTIKKVVQELKELKYSGRMEFYIYSDILADPRWREILKYVRAELPKACLMTSTSGDSFKSRDDIGEVFELGMNQMQINVYSPHDGSNDATKFAKGVEQAKTRCNELQAWVDTYTHVSEGGNNETAYLSQKLSLYQNIGAKKRACQVVAKFGIKKTTKDSELEGPNHFSNRSGNIPDFREGLAEPINKHCTRPFRFLNINWRGNAILCCNDFYGEATMGNVAAQSLVEIWNSANFHIYRLKLQNKKRDCFLCAKCDFNGGYYPHMTDHVTFGEEIDQDILHTDLRSRESIFETPVPVTFEQQGNQR